MEKQNCWEFMTCGREPFGAKVEELGVCPAAVDTRTDGINGGKSGGRACWAIIGTDCSRIVHKDCACHFQECLNCIFYWIVSREEGKRFVTGTEILMRLHILDRDNGT